MQHLQEIIANATAAINAAESLVALDEVRVQYLGKKGDLTAQLHSLGNLPPEERRTAGHEINVAKDPVQKALAA
nr:phenylalanine--tRNA ligase subunit alpha [Vibrio fluvialis]